MGVTYSIVRVGDQNQGIPVELVIKIISYLSVGDLTSCRLVNHTINDIIHSSPYIQHQIDTALAGVVDNPNARLSLSGRRHALALRQQAWDCCKPQHITTSKSPCFPDFIQCGVYFTLKHPEFENCVGYRFPPQPDEGFDGLWSYLSPLPKQQTYSIIALAVCLEENDLVAVGIRHANSLQIDLLSFASSGGEHQSASEPTLTVTSSATDGTTWRMHMDIRAGLLAVLVDKNKWGDGNELFVFDWKTAQNIVVSSTDKGVYILDISLQIQSLREGRINAFRFLADKVMVVANITGAYTGSFDLFIFSELKDGKGRTSMVKVVTLLLPVPSNFHIFNLAFGNLPPKSGVARRNHQRNDMVSYNKPFINSSDDIIYVAVSISDVEAMRVIHFVVHSSALLRHIPPTPFENSQNTDDDPYVVPWDIWGPTATRWFYDMPISVASTCAQRQICCPYEIRDFNQYRVKQLGEGFSVETETAHISVITTPSNIRLLEGRDISSSSLPYVKIEPKQWSQYQLAQMCLDDDRILVMKSGFLTPGGEVDHIYFG